MPSSQEADLSPPQLCLRNNYKASGLYFQNEKIHHTWLGRYSFSLVIPGNGRSHHPETFRYRHGYRVKTGAVKLTTSHSVQEEIAALSDPQSSQRCTQAYAFLINCSHSSYTNFAEQRKSCPQIATISYFKSLQLGRDRMYFMTISVPVHKMVWIFHFWKKKTESTKVAFFTKAFRYILDYATSFELLLLQYNMWIFKTVTGAINSARVLNCSPLRALDTQTFLPDYWQWQHRFLLDAVSQFGFHSLFLTISP